MITVSLRKQLAGTLVIGLLASGATTAGAQTPPVIPPVQQLPNPTKVVVAAPGGKSLLPKAPITMAMALEAAMRFQPAIIQARAALTSARGKVIQSRGTLLPSLALSSSYNGIHNLGGGTAGGSSSAPGYSESALVKQLLFDSQHARNLLNQADQLYLAAYFALRTQENNTFLSVAQAYISYCQARQLTVVSQDNVANRASQLALAQARLKSGLGLPSDMVNAQTALAQAQVQLSAAQNSEEAARINLALQIGLDPRTPIDVTGYSSLPSTAIPLETIVETAMKGRPEIAGAEAQLKAAKAAESAARTANDPTINGNLEVLGRGNTFGGGTGQLIAGISVQYTPYDGGIVAGEVEQARAAVTQVEALLNNTKLQAVSDAGTAYVAYSSAVQRKKLANAELFNARQAVVIATGRYRSGIGLFQDILTAQQSLVTAESDVANAQAAEQVAYAQLLHAEGKPQ